MHSTNLILPAAVDVGYAATVDVGPGRSVADNVVAADIDLANVDLVSVTDSTADVISDSVAAVWAIGQPVGDAVVNPWSRGSGQR